MQKEVKREIKREVMDKEIKNKEIKNKEVEWITKVVVGIVDKYWWVLLINIGGYHHYDIIDCVDKIV